MTTTLTGENRFALQQELRRIVDAFVKEHTDMALEQIDGEDAEFDRMREALQSLPFLASKKLVVLRAPGANKQFTESAEPLLTDLSEVTDVVIVEPKPDKRTAYYKFLKKHTDLKEFHELDTLQLSKWLVAAAKEAGGTLSNSDATYLVNRVGTNQLMLQNELQKLLNYNKSITRDSIDLLSERTPQSTTFDLLDAALKGDKTYALQLYEEQRSMKVEPQQIIALLGWQLHALSVVKTAGERDANQIASEAKLNPFVVRKTQSLARTMSLGKVKELVHTVRVLDERLKSESIDTDEALQNLIISL
jgi:DNA polymerase-3 subunit delta